LSIKIDYYNKYYSGRYNTYKLDRTTVTVGAPRMLAHQSSLGGRLFLRLCGRCLLRSNSSGCSALLRLCGNHFFRSSSCGLRALLTSRGLALHLRQELFDSGGWATTPSRFPHRAPLAFVALLNGLRRRYILQARKFFVSKRTRATSTLLHYTRWLTSGDVVSVTFNFFDTSLRDALRGFRGGAARLASRLVGGSSTRGT
jgi:hypothetical protein